MIRLRNIMKLRNIDKLVPPKQSIIENGVGIGDYTKISTEFIEIGEGITGNMIRMGLIEPQHTILDVGCGLGRLARPLVNYLTSGSYYGLDATKSSIEWCTDAYSDYGNFHFMFADVFSNTYNKKASRESSAYKFPYESNTFDFLWSTSLFTHMVFKDFENYIKEMARVMVKGAKCWNTFLLLDQFAVDQLKKIDSDKERYYMPYEVEGGRVRDLTNPEAQIALYEDKVKEVYKSNGLEIIEVRYGPWSGRSKNIKAGGQDVIIAQLV